MLKAVENVPFSATDYPITVGEVPQASKMLDRLLKWEQRDELIDCLAFQPDVGEPLGESSRIRVNVFSFETLTGKEEVTVVYFFHDLNMPLYILAIYEGHKVIETDTQGEMEMNSLAAELVQTYLKGAKRASSTNA